MNKYIKSIITFTIISMMLPANASAILSGDKHAVINDTVFFEDGMNCAVADIPGSVDLPEDIIKKINDHKDTYVRAAEQAQIPWQAVAALHYREAGLGTTVVAATAATGMYQITGKNYGLTVGSVLTETQLLEQSTDAAKFFADKVAANLPSHRSPLTASPDPEAVKDTFYSYNGRAGVYATVAETLGFSKDTQPYEGSPYVMNNYDATHQNMGIITVDHGGIDGVDTRFGAFTLYARLGGSTEGTADCASLGQTGSSIADIALGELGTIGYSKYVDINEEWCADFVSWVYREAGTPFTPDWRIASVTTMTDWFKANGIWVSNTSGAPAPQVGDALMHVYSPTAKHVNIVVSVEGYKVTAVGGNQTNETTGETRNNAQTEVSKSVYNDYRTDGDIDGWGRMK